MKRFYYILILISFIVLFSCSEKDDKKTKIIEAIKDSTSIKIDSSIESYPSSIFPVDESSKDLSLTKQISRLKGAINLKDTTILFELMDSNIVSSHGGGIYGYDGVIEVWKGKNIWKKLNQIINLGGVFNNVGNEFRLPYCQADKFYGSWDLEWYTTGVTLKPNSLLFIVPDSTSNVSDSLTYSIVETIDYNGDKPKSGMLHIKTVKEKKEGYIRYSDFYGTSDYMLIFEKNENSNWLITSFAPYD